MRTKDKDQGLQVGRINRRKQAWKRDQGCGWSILNQTRHGSLVSLSNQGVVYISGSPSGVEQGCGLNREQRETSITSAPWKHTSQHQMGATGVPSALKPGFKYCIMRSKRNQRPIPGLRRQSQGQGSLRGRAAGASIQSKRKEERWSRTGKALGAWGNGKVRDGGRALRGDFKVRERL